MALLALGALLWLAPAACGPTGLSGPAVCLYQCQDGSVRRMGRLPADSDCPVSLMSDQVLHDCSVGYEFERPVECSLADGGRPGPGPATPGWEGARQ
jgi:hypothetical protein